ncbi:hypothetical protein AB5J55_22305 [Streptomyces sp. R11]|uniref:Uncharacterized protein n=1 Tax=Streptomyces sp. R11 TaxID=3238625 RepID=A0AB39N2Q6_9ACTN
MILRCTSKHLLETKVVHLSLEIAPYDVDGVDYEPDSPYQCALSEEEHDLHGAFLRYIPDSYNEVWLFWDSVGEQRVVVLTPCEINDPDTQDDACSLFEWHPGKCNWDFTDPYRAAIDAMLETMKVDLRSVEGLRDVLRLFHPPDTEV